ncbi:MULTISPECIES: hypothetical protein [Flavobacterium]|jgi:hypothetical protein|uniref:Uncharacterized protein n=1 Tax=Flavobacterium quisquiliarum TaxID=1834436 RepID=A0ABV8W002_9FLAO|nr:MULTISPECIES: hypothetical protein [Flavobacterium]MBW1656048.1 hypothetical protein [Flavobacterium quisquiliarum]NWL01305.1 hypothetical protein [Flavobacterium collinsii]
MKTIQDKPFKEKQSIELTVGTFIISTVLFMLYIVSNESPNVLVIAWPFALFAIIVNLIMFVHLTDRFIHLPQQRKEIGIKILLLLSNIPITYLYYLIVMKN